MQQQQQQPSKKFESNVFWNNKGGVGKSILTFHVASLYAIKNPNREVLVVDICPQANVSLALLGGLQYGAHQYLDEQWQAPFNQRKTILAPFLTARSQFTQGNYNAVDISTLVINPSTRNPDIPTNLKLIIADPDLHEFDKELGTAASSASMGNTQQQNFKEVHSILRKSLQLYANKLQKPLTVFIDTNPAFTSYTAIGICAADKLVIPVKADDFSVVGAQNLVKLIYGPSIMPSSFATQASLCGINLPRIQAIIANQLTQYQGDAYAFKTMSSVVCQQLYKFYNAFPHRFCPRQAQINNIDNFDDQYFQSMRDFNSAGAAAAHTGTPMHCLQNKHSIQMEKIKISIKPEQVAINLRMLDELLDMLKK